MIAMIFRVVPLTRWQFTCMTSWSFMGLEILRSALGLLLRHLKCGFLCIYDGSIFDDSYWSKLDSIWFSCNAPIFDITPLSFMNHYTYSNVAWYNNLKSLPMWYFYYGVIFVHQLFVKPYFTYTVAFKSLKSMSMLDSW